MNKMTYKLITLEESKQIAIDENNRFNSGDFIFDKIVNKIFPLAINQERADYHNLDDVITQQRFLKIIASNFYIDKSIAMWKDEVEILLDQTGLMFFETDYERGYVSGFKKGYKSSSKKWTDEQLRKALEKMMDGAVENFDSDGDHWGVRHLYSVDEIIKSIQPQTIEFEFEIIPINHASGITPTGHPLMDRTILQNYKIKTITDDTGQLWCTVKDIR